MSFTIGQSFFEKGYKWTMQAAGFSAFTITGANGLLVYVKDKVQSSFLALPAPIPELLSLCGFDIAINLIISAYAAVLTFVALRYFRLGGGN